MAIYNNVVVTDAGIQFMRNIALADTAINAANVVTSESVITSPNTATTIPNVKQQKPFSLYSKERNQIILEAQLTNAGVIQGYNLNTVGFYVNDGTNANVLLAVITAQTPDLIPPETAYPINLNFKAIIVLDSGGNVQINTSFSGFATMEELNAHIIGTLSGEDGVHGIRDKDGNIQFLDSETGLWENITNSELTERVDELEIRTTEIQTQIISLQDFVGYVADKDVFGVEVNFAARTFKRLAGAEGLSAGADFDGIQCFGGRRRCNVADNGTITAYYGDSNYREDGSNGQVMVYQPKFYYRVIPLTMNEVQNGKGFHLRKAQYYVSPVPKDGFKLHPAFVKAGTERPYILKSAYEGCLHNGSAYILNDAQQATENTLKTYKLSSIANAKPASGLTQQLTRRNCGITAENRGTGWSQEYGATAAATQILMLVELGTFNTQETIGRGVVDKTDDGSTSMTNNTGATASLGNASGMASGTNGLVSVSYRGEENPWGNIWKFVDGLNIEAYSKNELYVADNTFSDNASAAPSNYVNAGITLAKANGYVSAMAYSEIFDWLFFPSETLGDDHLPVGDYFWQNNAATNFLVARLGAYWNDGSVAGGFCWHVNNAVSYRSRSIGGRLVYVPIAA